MTSCIDTDCKIAALLDRRSVGNFLLALGELDSKRNGIGFVHAWTLAHLGELRSLPPCPFCQKKKKVDDETKRLETDSSDIYLATQTSDNILRFLHVCYDPPARLANAIRTQGSRGGSCVEKEFERAVRKVAYIHPEWIDERTLDAILYVEMCQMKADDYDFTEYLEQMPLIENIISSVIQAHVMTSRCPLKAAASDYRSINEHSTTQRLRAVARNYRVEPARLEKDFERTWRVGLMGLLLRKPGSDLEDLKRRYPHLLCRMMSNALREGFIKSVGFPASSAKYFELASLNHPRVVRKAAYHAHLAIKYHGIHSSEYIGEMRECASDVE